MIATPWVRLIWVVKLAFLHLLPWFVHFNLKTSLEIQTEDLWIYGTSSIPFKCRHFNPHRLIFVWLWIRNIATHVKNISLVCLIIFELRNLLSHDLWIINARLTRTQDQIWRRVDLALVHGIQSGKSRWLLLGKFTDEGMMQQFIHIGSFRRIHTNLAFPYFKQSFRKFWALTERCSGIGGDDLDSAIL